MDVIIDCCAGLDVHAREVVAAVRSPDPGRVGRRRQVVRRFPTFWDDLVVMARWLAAEGVTEVAMESTGVYWFPVWQALELHAPTMTLRLVNSQHVKMLPGRKSDVNDAAWLAQLLECGLLRSSFVPAREIRELRDLTRLRKKLVQERTREQLRVHKVLETAGIKLGQVASETLGMSGRSMIEAMIAGEDDPTVLADMALRRLRNKIPELQRALVGRFGEHHRFLLSLHLERIDHLDADIARLDERLEMLMVPFDNQIKRLQTIPGVGRTLAWTIIAETGGDVAVFPSAGHLASWAGICPGSHESAGKHFAGTPRKGNAHLRQAACEAAMVARNTKNTYLAAQYRRLAKGRSGSSRAAMAVGHSILVAAWHILANQHQPGEPDIVYQDLGGNWFERRQHPEQRQRHLIRQLQALGVQVTITPAA